MVYAESRTIDFSPEVSPEDFAKWLERDSLIREGTRELVTVNKNMRGLRFVETIQPVEEGVWLLNVYAILDGKMVIRTIKVPNTYTWKDLLGRETHITSGVRRAERYGEIWEDPSLIPEHVELPDPEPEEVPEEPPKGDLYHRRREPRWRRSEITW